jgi:hypothetical protein
VVVSLKVLAEPIVELVDRDGEMVVPVSVVATVTRRSFGCSHRL